MKKLPLFGSGIKSYAPSVTAQRRLNCFYDPRPDGDKNMFVIRGTPGTVLQFTLPTFPVRGWRVVAGVLYIVAGASLYSVTSNYTVKPLGNLVVNAASPIGIADNGAQIIIVDGVAGYIFTLATSVLSVISDGNFPNGAQTVSFLDGYFQCELPGTRQYFVSQSFNGASWTPVAFATKESSSDPIVAVETWNSILVLWGSNSIEFWQDVGAPNVPYQRISGAAQSWGLAAVYSRAQIANTIAFLGLGPQGSVQVMVINGYTPTRISTSDIENLINSFPVYTDAVALAYTIDGHPMYQLTFPTGGRSFLYDMLTNQWQEVQTGVAPIARHYANLAIAFQGENFVSDYSSGNVYQLSTSVYTDNGQPIKRQCTSLHLRSDGNPFSIDEVQLDMETGVGLENQPYVTPQIVMQVSKDGGRTFGYERWVSIGQVGQYRSPRVIWRRLGSALDFVLQFTMTDSVEFIISAAYASSLELEGGAHG